ncbi:MAG: hypothetical protein IKL03_04460 [Bacteroidaceae bacterium]|nr:hypothetical protein [Bacteroidaceae bacterium]
MLLFKKTCFFETDETRCRVACHGRQGDYRPPRKRCQGPYTEGIKILEDTVAKWHKFEFPAFCGADLASEHERYFVGEHFKRPA